MGKASISFDPKLEVIYFIQGRDVCSVDLSGNIRTLFELPVDEVTAYTHVSKDGSLLCVPTTDFRAIATEGKGEWAPSHNIDERIQKEKLNSYLRIFDTQSEKLLRYEVVPKCWITHVQFCPLDKNLLLYNHEWPSFNLGTRRLWLWDGKSHHKLREEKFGKSSSADWIYHEMWSSCGKYITYHGAHKNSINFVGRIDIAGNRVTEIDLPKTFTDYGHFTIGNDESMVSDGYFREEHLSTGNKRNIIKAFLEKTNRRFPFLKKIVPVNLKRLLASNVGWKTDFGKWISIQKVDWENGIIEWYPLCKHGSHGCRTIQDSHTHPVFSNDCRYIYFTSVKDGVRGIYQVANPLVEL